MNTLLQHASQKHSNSPRKKLGVATSRIRSGFISCLIIQITALLATPLNADSKIERNHPSSETLAALQKIAELSIDDKLAAELFALEHESKVAQNSIDDAYLKLTRAQILLTENRFQEAINPLSTAIASNALDSATQERTIRGLGQVLYHLDRRKELIALFNTHFENRTNISAETLQLYAVALLQDGQSEPALRRCEQALSKKSAFNPTLCQIAASSLQDLNRFSESARYIELMLAKQPDNATLWDQVVTAYYRAGNLWATFGAIERAQEKRFKTDRDSQISKVEILYELESYAAAAKLIESWIEQDSQAIEKRIWLLLVYCYEQQNLAKQATATLQRASQLTPWPEMDLQLADRHWKTGDFAATYDDIMRAMEKGPVAKPADAWTLAAAAAISLERIDDAAHAAKEARAAGADSVKIERLEKSIEQLRKRPPPDPEAADLKTVRPEKVSSNSNQCIYPIVGAGLSRDNHARFDTMESIAG